MLNSKYNFINEYRNGIKYFFTVISFINSENKLFEKLSNYVILIVKTYENLFVYFND